MKQWTENLVKEVGRYNSDEQGVLFAVHRLHEKQADIKYQIYKLGGNVQNDKADPEQEKGNILSLDLASKNKGKLSELYNNLEILEEAEKPLMSFAARTNVNPETVKDIQIAHGKIFGLKMASYYQTEKMKNMILASIERYHDDPHKPAQAAGKKRKKATSENQGSQTKDPAQNEN